MDEESIQDFPPQPPKSKKVFINCVDTYQGSNLAKVRIIININYINIINKLIILGS